MSRAALAGLLLLGLVSAASAAEPASLAKARALYNAGNFEEAVSLARAARKDPAFIDSATLVMSRALLERYRVLGDPADLASAREALGMVRVAGLSPRDQVDLLIGLGEGLYLSEVYGAAADLFEIALARAAVLGQADRTRLLDWWATALDREAQSRVPDRRGALFARLTERMEEEIRRDPGSPAPNYWLVVAARGQGDLEHAWDAAAAAWVRATLSPATADTLRADLDQLVTEALIPERARMRPAREQQEAAAMFRSEWDALKQQWK